MAPGVNVLSSALRSCRGPRSVYTSDRKGFTVTPVGTRQGRAASGQPCTECGIPIRDPGNANAGLCHKHNPDRPAARAAQQRRRRYATTAPPIRLTPPEAHWLHAAMVTVTIAENSLRRSPNNETVRAILNALDNLHDELDPALAETTAVLLAYPSGTPRRPS